MTQNKPTTIIHSGQSLFEGSESFTLEFRAKQTPIRLNCRILLRDSSSRHHESEFNHPAPPFSRLFIFKSGTAELRCNGASYTLRPGSIHLLPATVPFTIRYSASELLHLHLYLSDITESSVFALSREIMSIHDPELTQCIIHTLEGNDPFVRFSQLIPVIHTFIEPLMDQVIDWSAQSQKLVRLFNWLKDKQLATITVSQAAELYQITDSAFSKRFKRCMGISFKSYITAQQVQHAQHTLLYTDKRISEIADDLGFNNSQYFHRFFKTQCQLTPEDYRTQSRSIV